MENYRDEVINVALHYPMLLWRDDDVDRECLAERVCGRKDDRGWNRRFVRAMDLFVVPIWAR